MADNKMTYIAVGVIAAVAVVAIVALVLLSDNEGEYDKYEGKYFIFDASGNSGPTTFDGTIKMEITEVKGSIATIVWTYDIYQTTSGVRTPYDLSASTKTSDLSKGGDAGVWQRSETLSTKWGPKTVDVYLEASGGNSNEAYVDKDDRNILYKMVMTSGGNTITVTLSETNYI